MTALLRRAPVDRLALALAVLNRRETLQRGLGYRERLVRACIVRELRERESARC